MEGSSSLSLSTLFHDSRRTLVRIMYHFPRLHAVVVCASFAGSSSTFFRSSINDPKSERKVKFKTSVAEQKCDTFRDSEFSSLLLNCLSSKSLKQPSPRLVVRQGHVKSYIAILCNYSPSHFSRVLISLAAPLLSKVDFFMIIISGCQILLH